MPINTLEFARITQTELDRQVEVEATSGWMELNSSRVRYNGGNEVKIPILDMDGMGDYDRADKNPYTGQGQDVFARRYGR